MSTNEVRYLMDITSLKEKAKQLKNDTYALYLAYKDPRVPWYAKAFTAVIVGYVLNPIDLIPDFIPVLGYLDDLIIVAAGISLSLKMIPKEILEERREKAKSEYANAKFGSSSMASSKYSIESLISFSFLLPWKY